MLAEVQTGGNLESALECGNRRSVTIYEGEVLKRRGNGRGIWQDYRVLSNASEGDSGDTDNTAGVAEKGKITCY